MLLNIDQLRVELAINELKLLAALKNQTIDDITELSIQRATLKDMLIEALEQALNNKGLEKLRKVG